VAEPGLCAARAAAAGEPLAGTASRFRHWLMVEQPGPWGYDALVEGGLPTEVGAALEERGDDLGIRVLLIRRRDRPTPTSRRCFAAFTGRQEQRVATFEVDDPRELLSLDLHSLVERRWKGFGRRVAGPLFLVCTHGKRDPCCSRYGGPPARALADRPDVWECTHVGGDRFAGNLVCFPHGLYFGRVDGGSAARVADAYARGTVVLEHYRGRSSYPPAVQAAEHELRTTLGLGGVDDLVLAEHVREMGGRHRVVFQVPGGERRRVVVRESRLEARLLTCKAEHPHAPRSFVLEHLAPD
jgi:hypothetical protein